MGNRRTQPNDAIFRARQRYYRKNRARLIAKATALYQRMKEEKLQEKREHENGLKRESSASSQKQAQPKGLYDQCIQQVKSWCRGVF